MPTWFVVLCASGSAMLVAAGPTGAVEKTEFDSRAASVGAIAPGVPARARVPALPSAAGTRWLKIDVGPQALAPTLPVVIIHAARPLRLTVFALGVALPVATTQAAFGGFQDSVYLLPRGFVAGEPLYARIDPQISDVRAVAVTSAGLRETLDHGAAHARIIDLVAGALVSMALAALLIWLIVAEKLFLLYATLFFLQAWYIAFLSGQAFDWPLGVPLRPLTSFAWNVPVGLSGAVACLFTREISDLKDFSPWGYRAFGRFAAAFLVLTVANLAKLAGHGAVVNAIGNLIFFVAALFTLVFAFLSWRRGNRAAGWFLVAWTLLEAFTIAAALSFLFKASDHVQELIYYHALPLSMVAAAVLIALGVADRLRRQRAALGDAERRAQTDPLTGVLNRRSLLESLDAACARARARGLPISLLFIDLDHFKSINDSFGHQAGDACLRSIIGPIQAELRQSDVIGRFGGEEFVVVLSSADAAAALPIAQRILERVANVRVDGFSDEPLRLTCSIGVAASDTLGVWGEHLIARADVAVYAAKRLGRNQVQLASI